MNMTRVRVATVNRVYNRNKNKLRLFIFPLTIVIIIALGLHFKFRMKYIYNHNENYFINVEERIEDLGMLINLPRCSIPNFKPWDEALIPSIHDSEQLFDPNVCKDRSQIYSYLDGNTLVLNKSGVEETDSTSISCCYKVIKRVEQPIDNYTSDVDDLITYSECHPVLAERTPISDEFIVVECFKKNVTEKFYYGFHASTNMLKSTKVEKKVKYWKDKESEEIPPSILIIGLDSTSRLQFRRRMHKTHKLMRSLGATEMLGYIKVADNTYPNTCPILTGYTVEEVEKICHFNKKTKFDDCPFIWKRLDEANYLTGHTEDWPEVNSFNFMKTGFVKKPVDFYPRPLFLSSDNDYNVSQKSGYKHCMGPVANDKVITDYLESTLDYAFENSTPIFTYSWSSKATHDDTSMLQVLDDTYFDFLSRIIEKGYLENTILILLSDHGYRYGTIKQTLPGFYENKLPLLWIALPPVIRKRFPVWQKYLEINARRLSTPFTLYQTLNLLVDVFSSINVKYLTDSVDNKTGKIIPRKHRQNFFLAIDDGTSCSNIGVPDTFCPCYPIKTVSLEDPLVLKVASLALDKINDEIESLDNPNCSNLSLLKVKSSLILDKSSLVKRYVVGFITNPGGFNFEAEIDYLLNDTNSKGEFQGYPVYYRIDKINVNFTKCVTRKFKLISLCYCKS